MERTPLARIDENESPVEVFDKLVLNCMLVHHNESQTGLA